MSKQPEKMPPQNIEAEQSVLGSIIIDPAALIEVADFLRAEDFYRDAHRTIYETILSLYARHEQADSVTICDALERHGKLGQVGGRSYINSLVVYVPTSGNVVHYARIVERTSVLRQLIIAGREIVGMAYEDVDDASPIVERAEQLIFEVSQRATSVGTDASLAELLTQYFAKLEVLASKLGQIVGVPSGFADLDRLTTGFRKSDFIIVAARPAVGKTSFALSIAYNAALKYKQRVGIFSLEMSQEQLTGRILSMETGINLQRLNAGNIEDHEWEKVIQSITILSDAQIRVDGTSVLSPVKMRSHARRWVQEEGMDLLIVDYIQLMQSDDERSKRENRVQVVDEISRNLKLLARELNIPILALAQLSRAVETRQSKVPQLSDLRESGGLEQNADIVMFIYRDEVYNAETDRKGVADIIVAKHRNGPTGTVALKFDPQTTRFSNLDWIVSPLDAPRQEEILLLEAPTGEQEEA